MNLAALKAALKPQLHKIEVNGIELYIHRPSIKNASLCTSYEAVLLYCVKDENGKEVFSTEDSDELMNVTDIDQVTANDIYIKVLALVSAEDEMESTEKK